MFQPESVFAVLPLSLDNAQHVINSPDEGLPGLSDFLELAPGFTKDVMHSSHAQTHDKIHGTKKPYTFDGTSGYTYEAPFDLDPSNNGNDPLYFDLSDPPYTVFVHGTREEAWMPAYFTFAAGTVVDLSYSLQTPCSGGGGNNVDWNFVGNHEAAGGPKLSVYVPLNSNGSVVGHSGPTIASGFDIGQHNASDLQTLGLSSTLVTSLTPYLGLTSDAAKTYVAEHPLTITAAQAAEIDSAAHSGALARLVNEFDTAVGKAGAFWLLPNEAQTTIADVAFQYGSLAAKTPNFWSAVTHYQWNQAVSILRNFNDAYPTRRNDDANYLNEGLLSNRLQDGVVC